RATARTTSGAAQTFVVDLADRVTAVNPATATYRYDGHGRRTQVTKAGVTTVQVYSQSGQLMYQSGPASDGIFKSGFQTGDTPYPASTGGNKRYLYLDRHLIAEDGTSGRQYIHTDALGSPVRTSNSAGAPSGRDDYKPYGWGPTPLSKPSFTGHVADAETGLIYMQARYYDPYAGRFMATDPVAANPGSFNRYWYANNNPYKNVDPDGRNPIAGAAAGCALTGPGCPGGAIIGAVAGVIIGAAGVAIYNEVVDDSEAPQPTPGEDASRNPGEGVKPGDAFPDRPLPRDPVSGEPVPDAEAVGVPHTQLGTKNGSKGKYPQAREFDEKGKEVKTRDFTDHGRPGNHTNPHDHIRTPNPTGGTPRRGSPEPPKEPNPPAGGKPPIGGT
ncbi:MAG: hypothetical protein JNN30_00665, partial [Rhodanobacteraceae bacterium]|nr:hypothetical protein [Rhodanobacteraceae bacterium]